MKAPALLAAPALGPGFKETGRASQESIAIAGSPPAGERPRAEWATFVVQLPPSGIGWLVNSSVFKAHAASTAYSNGRPRLRPSSSLLAWLRCHDCDDRAFERLESAASWMVRNRPVISRNDIDALAGRQRRAKLNQGAALGGAFFRIEQAHVSISRAGNTFRPVFPPCVGRWFGVVAVYRAVNPRRDNRQACRPPIRKILY